MVLPWGQNELLGRYGPSPTCSRLSTYVRRQASLTPCCGAANRPAQIPSADPLLPRALCAAAYVFAVGWCCTSLWADCTRGSEQSGRGRAHGRNGHHLAFTPLSATIRLLFAPCCYPAVLSMVLFYRPNYSATPTTTSFLPIPGVDPRHIVPSGYLSAVLTTILRLNPDKLAGVEPAMFSASHTGVPSMLDPPGRASSTILGRWRSNSSGSFVVVCVLLSAISAPSRLKASTSCRTHPYVATSPIS